MSGRQCSLTARRTWLQIRPRVFLYRVCWDWLQQTQLGKRMCWCESSRKENNSPSLVIHFSFLVKKLSHTVTSCHMYQSHPTCTKCICHTLHVPVNKWSPGTFVPQKRCDWLFRPHLLTSLNLCSDSLYGISRQIKTTSVISLSAQSALQHFHVQIQTLIAGVTHGHGDFPCWHWKHFLSRWPHTFFFFYTISGCLPVVLCVSSLHCWHLYSPVGILPRSSVLSFSGRLPPLQSLPAYHQPHAECPRLFLLSYLLCYIHCTPLHLHHSSQCKVAPEHGAIESSLTQMTSSLCLIMLSHR